MKSPGRGGVAHVEDLLRFASRALEEERFASVAAVFERVDIESLGSEQAEAWWLLLTEAGHHDCAERLRAFEFARPDPEEGLGPARDSGEGEGADEFLDFQAGERSREQEERPGEVARALARRVRGRGDVYARQWHDFRRERTGYQPVRAPLTREVLQRHVEGKVTVGQYLLHEDSTVSFAVIDLDPSAECLARMRVEGGAASPLGDPAMREYCTRILQTAGVAGLAPLAEDTGGKGLHIWFFFAPRITARSARSMMRDLLVRAGPQPPSIRVEIFPKQDHLSGKGLGNLVKLPFGVHQATQRRSRILDRALVPIPDEDAPGRLQLSDPSAVAAWANAKVRPLRGPVPGPGDSAKASGDPETPEIGFRDIRSEVAAQLAEIAPETKAREAFERVVTGCPVVRELVRIAHEERRLTADQSRALVYTVGLVGRENVEVDRVLAQAEAPRRELVRVRRGRQLPMGCARIRQIVSFQPAPCRCPEPPAGMYPSPVLFALEDRPRRRDAARPPSPVSEDFVAQVEAEGIASLEARMAGVEDLLRRLLDRTGGGGS